MITIYLSGPMSGTKEESTKWRNEIKEYIKNWRENFVSDREIASFNILDPCTRWFDDKDFLWDNSSWIVKLDEMEIEKADVLIVNAGKNANAWGTPMEQKSAWDNGKFIIAFCDSGRPSIWAKEHCHVLVHDHIDAAEWLCNHSVDIERTI